jgi:hypothetical protein
MSQNIYPIQLLNDLHNYFPELLYNPRQFQNVQDVLGYIRSVANMTPLERGQHQYNNRHNTYPNRQTPSPGLYNTVPVNSAIPVNSTIPQAFVTTMFEDNIPTARVRVPMNNNTNALMNTLLGGLFGDILGTGGANLNTFLNERVLVFPTNEEIENASTIYRATRNQDDICTICQDSFEQNQEIRRLRYCNHSFHRDCIDTWFHGNVHCPTCRHDIREVEVNQQPNQNTDNNPNNSPPPVPDNYRRMNINRPDNN